MVRSLVVYTGALVAAAAVLTWLAIYTWRRASVAGARFFSVSMAAVAGWSLASVATHLSSSLGAKLFWTNLQYVGIALVPATWLLFALAYTGRGGLRDAAAPGTVSGTPCVVAGLRLGQSVSPVSDARLARYYRCDSDDGQRSRPSILGAHGLLLLYPGLGGLSAYPSSLVYGTDLPKTRVSFDDRYLGTMDGQRCDDRRRDFPVAP